MIAELAEPRIGANVTRPFPRMCGVVGSGNKTRSVHSQRTGREEPDHTHNTILCLKDPHIQQSADRNNPTKTTQPPHTPCTVEQHRLLTATPTLYLHCLSHSPHIHTDVVCLINCQDLTFDLLTHPHKQLPWVKGHTEQGTHPPPHPLALQLKHGSSMPRQTRSNQAWTNTTTHMHAVGHTHKLIIN